MALPSDEIPEAIAGMEAVSGNGLRYPFPHTAPGRMTAPEWRSGTRTGRANST